jgi:hypothetical protein
VLSESEHRPRVVQHLAATGEHQSLVEAKAAAEAVSNQQE